MSPRIWDPYSVLNIIDRNSNSATCVGKTVFDKRCRWDISDANIREIRTILNEREKKRPKYAKKHLRTLAQLSLCEGYHQCQASEVIGAWEDSIDDAEANVATNSQTIADLKLKLQKRDKKIGQQSKVIEAWEELIDDAEANVATDPQFISDLKLKLQKRENKIAQQSEELELAIKYSASLLNRVERQRSQLNGQERDLEQTTKEFSGSLVRAEILETRRLAAYKKFDKLEHDLVKAAAKQALLSEEATVLRIEYVKGLTTAVHLGGEYDNLKAELSNAQKYIDYATWYLKICPTVSYKRKTELDTLRVTPKATTAELSRSDVASDRQTAKLHGAQNRTKQVQLDLQTLRDANVELEANLTAAQSTLKQTRLEFENSLQTAEKQRLELANVRTTLDQTVVELVNSRKSNEEQGGELSIMKKLLQQAQLESESNLQTAEKQRLELSNIQTTLDETVVELVKSHKSNEEQDGELSVVKKLLQQTELGLETSRKRNEEQDGKLSIVKKLLQQTQLESENNLQTVEKHQLELANVQTTLDQTGVELVNSRKSNEERDRELSIVKKLLQQTELDLETSRKVDKNQKANLEDNLKAYEEQSAKLDGTQALLKSSQVELDNSRKTALEQKETADALVARMQAQIAGLQEQLSRSFMDRVVLRFQKWFATVMREMKVRAGGQRGQVEEGSHMMV